MSQTAYYSDNTGDLVFLNIRNNGCSSPNLILYKIETSSIENFRRIHNLLRSMCKLIIEDVVETKPKAEPEQKTSEEETVTPPETTAETSKEQP